MPGAQRSIFFGREPIESGRQGRPGEGVEVEFFLIHYVHIVLPFLILRNTVRA
ncbi:hypothetical protein GALL_152070 [mine drainage metagenome]|uniref:Uncharacterized protein n=1 Tax=mine drainage metagenome TaxID=410659 RepID=A0A1J5S2X7_9ZZZZ